jgi:hypothetical protein
MRSPEIWKGLWVPKQRLNVIWYSGPVIAGDVPAERSALMIFGDNGQHCVSTDELFKEI